MKFIEPLIPATLIRRYKRFLTDATLEDGTEIIAHCTNTGAMTSCIEEGAPILLSPANNPKRKTQYTWEMIFINQQWVGINTGTPNKLAEEFVRENLIPGLPFYNCVKREVKWGDSRFDLYAKNEQEECYIEVKNVTLRIGDQAQFPDVVSTRALKHLHTLMEVKKQGMRAVMIYIIQRMDISSFGPATHIYPEYAKALYEAIEAGVEVYPVQVKVSPQEISYGQLVPLKIELF